MVKLIFGAIATLAAVACAAILANETAAPHVVVVVGSISGAVAVPLGGYGALRVLVALIPATAREQISLVIGVVAAGLEAAVQFTPTDSFTRLTLAVLIALAGAAGIWFRVTPLENPKAEDGSPLVPAGTPPSTAGLRTFTSGSGTAGG